MLAKGELGKIAQARLNDAKVLFRAGRFDGAVYLCGYAIELALKARICKSLSWKGYPSTRKEFENFQSFRTHDLDVLLRLSGREAKIKNSYLAEWSGVASWEPEARYTPIGSTTKSATQLMLGYAKALLKVI